MPRTRTAAFAVAALAALAALSSSPAFAAGGGTGGGGGSNPCAPLAMIVKVVHHDGNGNSGVAVQATIRDCATVPQRMQLDVSIPGSSTVPFHFTTGGGALNPGGSLTMSAAPIGSTPLQLHYGQTYDLVGTLTETGPTPQVLSTISTPVTMPPGVVG